MSSTSVFLLLLFLCSACQAFPSRDEESKEPRESCFINRWRKILHKLHLYGDKGTPESLKNSSGTEESTPLNNSTSSGSEGRSFPDGGEELKTSHDGDEGTNSSKNSSDTEEDTPSKNSTPSESEGKSSTDAKSNTNHTAGTKRKPSSYRHQTPVKAGPIYGKSSTSGILHMIADPTQSTPSSGGTGSGSNGSSYAPLIPIGKPTHSIDPLLGTGLTGPSYGTGTVPSGSGPLSGVGVGYTIPGLSGGTVAGGVAGAGGAAVVGGGIGEIVSGGWGGDSGGGGGGGGGVDSGCADIIGNILAGLGTLIVEGLKALME